MLERRRFIRIIGEGTALLAAAACGLWPRRAVAATHTAVFARAVTVGDAGALQAIMTTCVAGGDSFFGKCGEWSRAWADDLVVRCPDTLVLSSGATPIAFLEIPPIRPVAPALSKTAGAAERERDAVRHRNRTTLRVSAAGVRDDLLDRQQSVAVFRALLHDAFARARALGYEAVEAVAPWEQHPRLAKRFTDYPGCTLVEPVSYAQGGGRDCYWLRWQLDAAVAALAAEGAGTAFDVSIASPRVRS